MSAAPDPKPDLPRLSRDRAFWGLTLTQFLGAFNDNVFKQLVLLICVSFSSGYQTVALAIFSLPFVFFSGFAGWLADRNSKRGIVVLAKVAEIGIMLAGMLVFLFVGAASPDVIIPLFVVLGCMSLQSTFFGPPKYGILPELFREGDLPAANGVIQMTTFLAIIFGTALAGIGKEHLGNDLWMLSGFCVATAVAGTLTSLLVRGTPIAQPNAPFETGALLMHPAVRQLLKRDRTLLGVLLISSLFWFVGGVIPPAVNEFGVDRLRLGDGRTSVMLSFMGVGIAAGCVAAAKLSHHRIAFKLVTRGAWGVAATLAAVTILGLVAPEPQSELPEKTLVVTSAEPPLEMLGTARPWEWGLRLLFCGAGYFGGLFVVPLQVFIQARPPDSLKGQMIGAMNLMNWTAIVLAALFYGLCERISKTAGEAAGLNYLPIGWLFAALAALMVPVALFYRPRFDGDGDGAVMEPAE